MSAPTPLGTRLVLVSRSSARRRMLEAAGFAFTVADAAADEERAKLGFVGKSARELAMGLAEAKASSFEAQEGELALGADQTLELDDGSILGKAKSLAEAGEQLRRMSGRMHRLHSAAVACERGIPVWRCLESAELTMRPLSEEFIDRYLADHFEEVRWSVGCYHVEGAGVQLFERIGGSYFAILGLPLLPLLAFLRERRLLAS